MQEHTRIYRVENSFEAHLGCMVLPLDNCSLRMISFTQDFLLIGCITLSKTIVKFISIYLPSTEAKVWNLELVETWDVSYTLGVFFCASWLYFLFVVADYFAANLFQYLDKWTSTFNSCNNVIGRFTGLAEEWRSDLWPI